jgi:hypothetical protein
VGFLDTPANFSLDLKTVLLDKNLSKFGDAIVNFIYNAAIFEETKQSKGVKVWDSCLAQACKDSHLREFLGTRKNAGEIGDAVEAFIAYVYVRNKSSILEMIQILFRNIHQKKQMLANQEKELCTESFTVLINSLCEKIGIDL